MRRTQGVIGVLMGMIWLGGMGACARGEERKQDQVQEKTATSQPVADTPAGKRFLQWLERFNRGDYEALLAFHRETDTTLAAQRRALYDYRLYLMTRGFVPHRIEVTPANEVRVQAQEKLTGLWVSVLARFTGQPPYTMSGIGMIPVPPPSVATEKQTLAPKEVARRLETALQRMAEADVFSGAVLVAYQGKPILRKACGLASKAYNISNRPDTKFNLASMGKMFTGVAVMQLVQSGKLSLDATVGSILPDYPNKEVAEKVTVRHLLTHTGGLGSDLFNEKFRAASRDRFRTVKDMLPLFADAPLEFAPGSRWDYSNAGFVVLGAIIEKVTGQAYFGYLKAHIFQPAGMMNTDAYEMDRDTPNLAIGYTRRNARTREELERYQNNLFLHVIKGSPAGGCFSTADDLLKFALALQQHRLLDATHTEMLLRGKVEMGRPGNKYAFGFQEESRNGQRVVGHRGGFEGISTVFNMYPELGYTVIVLSNYDTVAQTVAFLAQNLLLRP